MADKISFEVLKDGTLKIETDKISPANHGNADLLIRLLQQKLGGRMTRTSRGDPGKGHHHDHAHDHHKH